MELDTTKLMLKKIKPVRNQLVKASSYLTFARFVANQGASQEIIVNAQESYSSNVECRKKNYESINDIKLFPYYGCCRFCLCAYSKTL